METMTLRLTTRCVRLLKHDYYRLLVVVETRRPGPSSKILTRSGDQVWGVFTETGL